MRSSKRKAELHQVIFSNHCFKGPARLGLALIHIKPNSSLNRIFQVAIEQGSLSKIKPFLDVHIDQHAAMTTSLKITLPKSVLDSIISKRRQRKIPGDNNLIPTRLAKRTFEEQVHQSFLHIGITNGTTVASKMHVFSFLKDF